ncbi:hypothetical protein AJ79_06780 [Helicocarpus griseus UAMH5409]|uniref:Uncharacterized protein n=1 Tax=Helicocarpus griseus UAMH5409 TaxID=1447875 RepID=A0A2B7X9M9_9EURO|nr:hypothetical protein AJ79_06780 [Helicocarpus griseus UAMH5409]
MTDSCRRPTMGTLRYKVRAPKNGVEGRAIAALHKRYGSVARIAPNEADIPDGVSLQPRPYRKWRLLEKSHIPKRRCGRFPTISSALDPVHRAIVAKAVPPLFAQQAIAKGRTAVQKVTDAMVVELQRRKADADGATVGVLNLFRAVAMDAVTVYLLGEAFGSVGQGRLTTTSFIDKFVFSGRFFYLAGRIFDFVDN